jgi:zinc and cadmium transporter
MTLFWIMAACLAGGFISVGSAAALSWALRAAWIPMSVSFAIGTMLGAAFLEVIPHAFEHSNAHTAALTILAGILLFFILEKLVLWRHCHTEHCEVHDHHGATHDHGRSGTLIVIGDAVHNLVDGVLIAAAFLESTQLGVVTAMAIVAHEIPQEVGDFLILLNSGYSRLRALALNALSSLATLIGGLIGYFTLQSIAGATQVLLGIVAASMIYVAVADLIPGLHKRTELRAAFSQTFLIAMGVAAVALVRLFLGHGH